MRHSSAPLFALIVGIVFLVVGILGFFDNPVVGPNGFFVTDTMHNSIHVVSGLLGIGFGLGLSTEKNASVFLNVLGGLYLIIAILGFIAIGNDSTGTFMGMLMSGSDNWLHLGLGVAIVAMGVATHPRTTHTLHHAR